MLIEKNALLRLTVQLLFLLPLCSAAAPSVTPVAAATERDQAIKRDAALDLRIDSFEKALAKSLDNTTQEQAKKTEERIKSLEEIKAIASTLIWVIGALLGLFGLVLGGSLVYVRRKLIPDLVKADVTKIVAVNFRDKTETIIEVSWRLARAELFRQQAKKLSNPSEANELWEKAEKSLNVAQKKTKNEVRVYREYVRFLSDRGHYYEAKLAICQVPREFANDGAIVWTHAFVLYKLGEYPKAAERCNTARLIVASDEDRATILHLRANCLSAADPSSREACEIAMCLFKIHKNAAKQLDELKDRNKSHSNFIHIIDLLTLHGVV